MENLNIALLLMIVGMATVFAILLIVIYLGKGLIALVNKYAPEEVAPAKQAANAPAAVPGNIMAAISAADTGFVFQRPFTLNSGNRKKKDW
jgi:oxaloacetate decarboxylase (Na+ extruding) subunit gamma